MAKKLFKLTKKASKSRGHVKRGVKEVVKALRKGEKGLVVLAGDISPIDILSPYPGAVRGYVEPVHLCAFQGGPRFGQRDQASNQLRHDRPGGGKKAAAKGKEATKPKEDYTEDYAALHKQVQTLSDQVALAV